MDPRLRERLCFMSQQALRVESAGGITCDVGDAREVRLAIRMQSADPAPAQDVACRVAIDEMAIEEVGAELPGQLEGIDPDTREPHSRMIVQVARRSQLPNPGIEAVNTGRAVDRGIVPGLQFGFSVERFDQRLNDAAVIRPDCRMLFQPALEVGAPEDLFYELGGRRHRVALQCRVKDLAFVNEAVPDVRRQP
jgi:hypothetical protein